MQPLHFTAEHLTRPDPSGIDVVTTLRHFAIVTYSVDPDRLQALIHPRFEPELVELEGKPCALVSVVPFFDTDFRFVNCPFPTFAFGQTNYRAYVLDTETGERVAWFFGTTLDSPTVLIPHHLWKLPWYHGRIRFECRYSVEQASYEFYSMTTESAWAPARLVLDDTGTKLESLPGFPDQETAEVLLTHPMRGYFFRRDGALGSYRIWHDRLNLTRAICVEAEFPLLDSLELVPLEDQASPHSVLVQHETEFTIYLPPKRM